MQLRGATVAAVTLVGLAVVAPGRRAEARDLRASVDTLVYADDDHVTVVSPQATVATSVGEGGGEISARGTVDVVSAASVDVISHATGAFHETRTAGELAASYRFGDWLPELRLSTSDEPDYLSLGLGLGVSRRLGGPDTVLRVAATGLHDRVGRTGTPSDVFSRTLDTGSLDASVAQNLDADTVVRATYSLVLQDGYQAKPYRYVPMFDASGARLGERPPEEVPGWRTRHAFALRALRWLGGVGSLRGDYRYYVDSWSMQAHTLDVALAVPLGGAWRVTVDNRLHYQTSVSFWAKEYVIADGGPLPRYRSLDRELSEELVDTASVRIDWQAGHFHTYADVGGQYARFFDFLLLDARKALLVQVGLRYDLSE